MVVFDVQHWNIEKELSSSFNSLGTDKMLSDCHTTHPSSDFPTEKKFKILRLFSGNLT